MIFVVNSNIKAPHGFITGSIDGEKIQKRTQEGTFLLGYFIFAASTCLTKQSRPIAGIYNEFILCSFFLKVP